MLVGITGFEPATSSSRTKRATKLRHIPVVSRTVVRGTRNTIPLGFGLAKTAGCVRFVAGVGAWRWRGGGVAVARCGAVRLGSSATKDDIGICVLVFAKAQVAFRENRQIPISSFRQFARPAAEQAEQTEQTSRQVKQAKQRSGAANGRPPRKRPPHNRPPRSRSTRARRPGSATRTAGRTGARVRTWTGRARWIPPSTCGRSGAGRRRVRGRCRRW